MSHMQGQSLPGHSRIHPSPAPPQYSEVWGRPCGMTKFHQMGLNLWIISTGSEADGQFMGCFPTKHLLLSHATLDKDYKALAKQEAAKIMLLSQRTSCWPSPDWDGMQTVAESRQLKTGAGLTCTLLRIQPEVYSVLPQNCHHPSWIQCQSVLLLLFVGRLSCSILTFIWDVDISVVWKTRMAYFSCSVKTLQKIF